MSSSFSLKLKIQFYHRTTTLNDIYRNMGMDKSQFNSNSIDNDVKMNNRQDQFLDDVADDEYEEGEVSGFVVQKPLAHGGINSFNPNVVSLMLSLLATIQ
jgi:hypothetical protein